MTINPVWSERSSAKHLFTQISLFSLSLLYHPKHQKHFFNITATIQHSPNSCAFTSSLLTKPMFYNPAICYGLEGGVPHKVLLDDRTNCCMKSLHILLTADLLIHCRNLRSGKKLILMNFTSVDMTWLFPQPLTVRYMVSSFHSTPCFVEIFLNTFPKFRPVSLYLANFW